MVLINPQYLNYDFIAEFFAWQIISSGFLLNVNVHHNCATIKFAMIDDYTFFGPQID